MVEKGSQFAAIWATAKAQYTAAVGEDIDGPSFPHPSSTDDLLVALEQQNSDLRHFREKRAIIFDILNGACRPIELVGNLAAGGAALVFPPSTLCFGAVMYLINAAHGVSASYDAIADLLRTLKDFLVRLKVYDREDLADELREKLAEILATLLEILARSTKVIKGGSGGRILRFAKNVLLGNDEKLQGLVTKLEKLCQSEHRLVGVETLTESKKTGRLVEGISVTLTETSMAVNEGNAKIDQVSFGIQKVTIGQEQVRQELRHLNNAMAVITSSEDKDESKRQKKIKDILHPSVSPDDLLDSITKRRVPGTGDWVRDEPPFQKWIDQTEPVLWISGNPGSGKTFLAESIISHLKQQNPQGVHHPSHVSIGFYFFKDSESRTRKVHQALRDIAYQISQNDAVYEKHLAARCSSAEDIETISSTWRNLFRDFFISQSKVDSQAYVVLDGIDEAFETERKEFLELLSDLIEASSNGDQSPRLHIVLIGRPQISEEIFDAVSVELPTIHVDSRKNNQDICSYVESSIKKSRVLNKAPKDLRVEIVTTLVDNAQGMFLWVDLMMRELTKKTRVSTIRASLHEAPKGLREMIRHVLERFSAELKDEQPDDLNAMLAWVSCAGRPLHLDEMDAILQLRSAEGDGVLNLENMLRKQFASFFLLIRLDGLQTSDLQSDRVNEDEQKESEDGLDDVENETDFNSNKETTEVIFCHASIGDFFRDRNQGKVSAGEEYPEIGVDIMQARMMTLKTCLTLVTTRSSTCLLRNYALSYWHQHLQEATSYLEDTDQNDKLEIVKLLLTLLRDCNTITDWVSQAGSEFYNVDSAKIVMQWLADNAVLEHVSPEDREWIISKLEKPVKIYSPMAELLAEKWLCGVNWDHGGCMFVVHRICTLLDDRDIVLPTENVPINAIMEAAEWPKLEKNALWHRRVAMCLRDYGHAHESKEHFETALQLDSKMWLARTGLVIVYMQLKDHEKAIELSKVNSTILEELLADGKERDELDPEYCDSLDLASTWDEMGESYKELGDMENAVLYYRKAIDISNHKYQYVLNYIKVLRHMGKFNEIIRLMKEMGDTVPGAGDSRLTECIQISQQSWSTFFRIVARAAKEVGEIKWLEDAYQTAINIAVRRQNSYTVLMLKICLAEIYYIYEGNGEKALPIWNRILGHHLHRPMARQERLAASNYTRNHVAGVLGKYLIRKAFQAGVSTAEAEECLKRLDLICKQKTKPVGGPPEIITTNYSALFIGLWHRSHGESDKARDYFKPYIKEALMLLSDDDPDNDNSAYYDLAHVLLAAGDEINATAVLHVVVPKCIENIDKIMTDTKDQAEQNENNGDAVSRQPVSRLLECMSTAYSVAENSPDFAFECDGPCHRYFGNWTDTNICRCCLADLCDDCIEPLKKGLPMKINVCSPDHEWFHVPVPKKIADSGKIYINDDLFTLEEFKDSIRKQWKV